MVWVLFVGWLLLAVVAPIYVGYRAGRNRGQTGWLYGLLLGWIGVIILVAIKPRPGSPKQLEKPMPLALAALCVELIAELRGPAPKPAAKALTALVRD